MQPLPVIMSVLANRWEHQLFHQVARKVTAPYVLRRSTPVVSGEENRRRWFVEPREL